jgi:hypothetical protein
MVCGVDGTGLVITDLDLARPNSTALTIDANRSEQSDSCDDSRAGERLTIMSAFPFAERHGCSASQAMP